MKFTFWLAAFVFVGCQAPAQVVLVLDGQSATTLTTSKTTAREILSESEISTQNKDRVLVNGAFYSLDQNISLTGNWTLQLFRAVSVQLISPQGAQTLQTSALTVGEFLKENGFVFSADDQITPPLSAPIIDSITVTYSPAQALVVAVDGAMIHIRSAAQTIGEALANAGIPLAGLDFSRPAENEPLPADGQIQVVRVKEIIETEKQPIPFSTHISESSDLNYGDQKITQVGEDGLLTVRTRVHYEDGVEVSRVNEGEVVVKEPITEEIAQGVKVALSPADGDSPYPYWRAVTMYASWYSPCNSGTGKCSYGTASGARAGFGVVAVDYAYYPYLAGMRVYIAGYGAATIGDKGGGPIVESAFNVPRYQWIDLGYDDNNIGGLSGWVTVYFLEPAPAEIPYFLK